MGKDNITLAVAIATAGRRDILTETIAFMNNQIRQPDEFLVCPARFEDVDVEGVRGLNGVVQIVEGAVGSSHQRNAMIEASNADVMVFFDDDFLPSPSYLAEVEALFAADRRVMVATGHVVADGALGPGLEMEQGRAILTQDTFRGPYSVTPIFNGYGCNMAIRLAPVRSHGIRFDENLPLYAWLEDVDFSRQMAAHGSVVHATQLRGVHLGTKKAGRSPGRRLGYSQIANRIYIQRKGNMNVFQVWDGNIRNLCANLFKSLNPEPWVDRRGRLSGNLLALKDLITGKLDPKKILDL
ncbi:glycosyltransferase [Rhizobium sp. AG855]|uniref:glycosyltransferase family 2 protein n=1 Tax=Rhizobium sp. AG855 TaxID=2183898 RepID=UPI000E737A66|nr:glycosyltransferase [Rhizobium sp. AG855]RKE77547.1 GT2 family glycosyltransferase [Rhizobium sp. AG855]